MAANGDIYIGPTGSEIYLSPGGRKLRIVELDFGREDRTSGGGLKKDTTSIKYRFELPYDIIDVAVLNQLITLRKLETGVNLRIYKTPTTWFLNDDGNLPVVRINPISRERYRVTPSEMWSDIDLVLEEI